MGANTKAKRAKKIFPPKAGKMRSRLFIYETIALRVLKIRLIRQPIHASLLDVVSDNQHTLTHEHP
ncbi:MAG TPA: hypothetical protein V6D14_33450 [Coleofasciculaceae cyanobacterium]